MVGRRRVLLERPDLTGIWDAVDALFPVRVTRSFAERADLADPDDPLARQVLPHPDELLDDGLDDPVGEKVHSPVPWLVRKYTDRVLWMVTKRCHLYCRYCFRRTHAPGEALDPTPVEVEAGRAYIEAHPEVREVILSGGDPLILRDEALFARIDAVLALGRRVRVHSRAPITFPDRVTEALAAGLAARGVFLVVHCNHARELAPDVTAALGRLVDAGVVVSNQAVLLRGVNDDAAVLVELFEATMRLRVRPYYLHHTDVVTGNSHFRLTMEEGRALYAEVRRHLGGMALPRYIWDPPDGSGKRDVGPG